MDFFKAILYKPLLNSLVLLCSKITLNDFGFAIILLTIIIRVLLFPLSIGAVKSQKKLQEIQPKLKGIQEKYKNDKEKQAKELLEVYSKEKINPFGGIFPLFIQLPILIALYSVFKNGLNSNEIVNLYSFVKFPENINIIFLGLFDLTKPSIIFATIAGLCQYFQTKMMLPKKQAMGSVKEEDFTRIMNLQMTYFLPIMTVIILLKLPSALGLYWIVSGLFSTTQQYLILNNKKSK